MKKNDNEKLEHLQTYWNDNANQRMTSNDGVPIHDNNNTLKGGERGPSLQQDHLYFDKLMHFDRERIPERVVHARGSGAHGVFEATADMSAYTTAKFLQPGKKTPVFVRFSTVAGFKGSTDLARDVRGFSVKFYTEDGNYDLVGNNIPVFFIQDAMNFPDLVHAVKPEPHHEMPQAASAHDTFWDFISLMPESAHMIMWVMSDRAIPRSLRMMEGFGVHTFKFVNSQGKGTFVKFHWKPRLGVHSVAWNEAQKISGFNSDFHRQDLWEAIDKGNFPQWDLGVQLVAEEDEHKFDFDLLDPTKIIPEELVPVKIIGTMTLNRNPENFFAETEQAAFDPGRVVPGIDFSNDPLLQGRVFSYMDTQNYRLGGPNFHELPINRPINGITNNQKDGFSRMGILKGPVSYFPNSKNAGCPYHALLKGETGFISHKETQKGEKVRQRPDSFADHFSQARLFYQSQAPHEQQHIINALSFELSKVNDPKIRERQVAILNQIDAQLANEVGTNLGITPADQLDPMTVEFARHNHPNYPLPPKKQAVEKSKALSMAIAPGEGTIASRKIAFLLEKGTSKSSVDQMKAAIEKEGAEAVLIAPHTGMFSFAEGDQVEIQFTYDTEASVCYDAVYTPGGEVLNALKNNPDYIAFIQEAYRHCKGLAFAQTTEAIVESTFIRKDPGVIYESDGADWREKYIHILKGHRVWEQEMARKIPI